MATDREREGISGCFCVGAPASGRLLIIPSLFGTVFFAAAGAELSVSQNQNQRHSLRRLRRRLV